MQIKTKELKELLNVNESDLKKLSVDQLRLLLGVAHFLARVVQREINGRLSDFSAEKPAAKEVKKRG